MADDAAGRRVIAWSPAATASIQGRPPLALLFFLLSLALSAPALTQVTEKVDTARTHPAASPAVDSTFFPFVPRLGYSEPPTRAFISDSTFRYSESMTKDEELEFLPFIYRPSFGMAYQPSFVEIAGLDPSHSPIIIEGLSADLSGSPDLRFVPFDALKGARFLSPAEALFTTMAPNAGAVDLSLTRYNTNRPYSRVVYDEGPYGVATLDGTFSQNVTRRTNASIGFVHGTADGRYVNDMSDGWNIRAMVQHQFTKYLLLEVSDLWGRFKTGLNGGVDLSQTSGDDVYNGLVAAVRNPNGKEEREQNDLRADIYLSRDSTLHITRATLRYNTQTTGLSNLYLYEDVAPVDMSFRSFDAAVEDVLYLGAFSIGARGEVSFSRMRGSFPTPSVSDSRIGASLRAGLQRIPFPLVVTGRIDHLYGKTYLGGSARAEFGFLSTSVLSVEASSSARHPTLLERALRMLVVPDPGAQSLGVERHTDLRGTLVWLPARAVELGVTGFYHHIDSPISGDLLQAGQSDTGSAGIPRPYMAFFNDQDPIKLTGASAHLRLDLWRFRVESQFSLVRYSQHGETITPVPGAYGSAKVEFIDTLFTGHLPLRLGIRARFDSRQEGRDFYSGIGFLSPGGLLTFGPSTVMDAYFVGKIGKAIIHLGILNVTDERTMLVRVYPLLDRSFHFGVNWEFWN